MVVFMKQVMRTASTSMSISLTPIQQVFSSFTPNQYSDLFTDPLPVMFFIHGGGYTAGSGRSQLYGPLFYLAHDIIVVTIRYRCMQ